MKVTGLLFFSVCLFSFTSISAQTMSRADSAKVRRRARLDAALFMLKKEDFDKFAEHQFPTGSDYFKPGPKNASRPELLNDSLYVQSFRYFAFYSIIKNHTRQPFMQRIINGPPPLFSPNLNYTNEVEKTAKKDAHRFLLTDKVLLQFREEIIPNTSDYFKPTPAYTSNQALLNDSAYVQAFRNVAFYRAMDQEKRIRTAIITGGVVLASVTTFVALVELVISSSRATVKTAHGFQ